MVELCEDETQRASSTRRILFVVVLLLAAGAALLLRDPEGIINNIPALAMLAFLAILALILLLLHRTGLNTALRKLHRMQLGIKGKEDELKALARQRQGAAPGRPSPSPPTSSPGRQSEG